MQTVAVVIPNYNGKKYLTDCLKSLQKQTFKDFCVIIVDNGSEDGSAEYIEKHFLNGALDVKLISLNENTGFANAVNVGIKEAEAEFVFLLNNDACCDEKAIEALVKAIKADDRIFSVQAKMLQYKKPELIDDAGDYYCALGWAFSPSKDKKSSLFTRKVNLTSACGGAAMYRKDILEEIGMFDKAHFCYLEDVDIGYRAKIYGYKNILEPGAIVYHIGSASSGSRHNVFKVELAAANNLYLIYKNMPVLQVIINFPLIFAGLLIKHLFYMKKGLGRAHLRGLRRGFAKILDNPDRKVKLTLKRALACVYMQLELWGNCFVILGHLGRF